MLKSNEEKFLNDVFLTLKKYIQNNANTDTVNPHPTVDELKNIIPDLSRTGVSLEEIHREFEIILEKSVRTIHPLFLNQLFGGFDVTAWTGEIASSLLNPTMATFEIAPVFTLIEKRLVKELLTLMGFDKGEGIMVTGGSNSNLLSILCARSHYNPAIRQTGFAHNHFRIYVSEDAHYSFDKAVNITGIGTQNLIQVPTNARGEMIPEELERILATDIKDGFTPLMVGATFGTTVLGAFDPVEKIAAICEHFKVWLHVDAAWGGAAVFSKSARHLTRGLEKADSVTFDAHKTMGAPLITSFFLTKQTGILRATNRGGGAEYLFHEFDNSDWDTGTYSLQCGRRADALKLWLLWRSQGTDGLMKRTEHLLDLATFAAHEVSLDARMTLIHHHYLNVCFQVKPLRTPENVNSFTLKVRKELLASGRAMVNYAERADGTIFLRLVFPNHLTEKSHVAELLKIITETAELIELNGNLPLYS
ncbi:MAG: pyridoxal-dependent decarboxylase [Bdellovibrionota bacterium]